MYNNIKYISSNYRTGFRKEDSSQYSVIVMFRNYSALFLDLLTAFYILPQDVKAKIYAYGFLHKSVKLIFNLLSGQKFRTKITSFYVPWEDHLLYHKIQY